MRWCSPHFFSLSLVCNIYIYIYNLHLVATKSFEGNKKSLDLLFIFCKKLAFGRCRCVDYAMSKERLHKELIWIRRQSRQEHISNMMFAFLFHSWDELRFWSTHAHQCRRAFLLPSRSVKVAAWSMKWSLRCALLSFSHMFDYANGIGWHVFLLGSGCLFNKLGPLLMGQRCGAWVVDREECVCVLSEECIPCLRMSSVFRE